MKRCVEFGGMRCGEGGSRLAVCVQTGRVVYVVEVAGATSAQACVGCGAGTYSTLQGEDWLRVTMWEWGGSGM